MAKMQVIEFTKDVVKQEKVRSYFLELDEDEAQALVAVTGHIDGLNDARRTVDRIYRALDVVVRPVDKDGYPVLARINGAVYGVNGTLSFEQVSR